VGTFTAGGLKIKVENGELEIIQEGKVKKFVKEVEHKTFSGEYAVEVNQPVLYITERAVFKLMEKGLELIEIAPGIDIEKHIIAQMEFTPLINGAPKLMDKRIFKDSVMKIRDELLIKTTSSR
jgi:propionate CoA-transferase